MKTYNSFGEMADDQNGGDGTMSDMSAFNAATINMTQVAPKIMVTDTKLQAYLQKHWIGCNGLEYEVPHITIKQNFGDNLTARLLLSDGQLMEPSGIDREVIKAVQVDRKIALMITLKIGMRITLIMQFL